MWKEVEDLGRGGLYFDQYPTNGREKEKKCGNKWN